MYQHQGKLFTTKHKTMMTALNCFIFVLGVVIVSTTL